MATRSRTRKPVDQGRSKTVTLQDVAHAAGVTSMTVSRVMKGAEGVGANTRERVLRIAQELNYTVNPSARALATGKTGAVAIISGGLNHLYYSTIVHLLEEELSASGYQMRLLHTHSDVRHLINSTHSAAVDGVIIVGKYHLVEEFRAFAPQAFESCVFIDSIRHQDNDYVQGDLKPAVEEALELMLGAGRTRLAYVGHFHDPLENAALARRRAALDAPALLASPEERLNAYWGVMQRAGLQPELIGNSDHFVLTPANLVEYLRTHGCPTGLLCVNDETAVLTYRALLDAGFRVPDDALLVGCDDLFFTRCFDPPLSTISLPYDEMCARAWQFLQARLADPTLPIQNATFDAKLVVRASLQAPATQASAIQAPDA